MTQLERWIKINSLYDDSCPGLIQQKLIINRSFIANLFYSLFIISPPIIGLLIIGSKDFYMWLLLIYVVYLQLSIYLNNRMLYPHFQQNGLQDLPVLQRRKYLHYARFQRGCDQAGIDVVYIKNLLQWYKAGNAKKYKSGVIIKLLIASLTSIAIYIHQLQEISMDISGNKLFVLVLLTALFYMIIYVLFDVVSTHKRRDKKISIFLQMYQKEPTDII
ncbi:MAG: hypothetical protein JKX98_10995 [Alcanivoracaceae bacterium]|nr:hypothetical protein [Alcanivoracaceae bacterium]